MNLKEVKIGNLCKVLKVNTEGALRKRILDMGITPGVQIKLIKIAPLGDPIEISLRGYNLSLRGNEAKTIIVKEV